MDGLYCYLKEKGISNEILSAIKSILEFEEYDSCSIEEDVLMTYNVTDSNIAQLTKHSLDYKLIAKLNGLSLYKDHIDFLEFWFHRDLFQVGYDSIRFIAM